ncbi:MAG: phosphate ABC transporter ATP-binding protein [Chloroflexi bacterium]|nr:phosphate ABC transporter ATP-binding protein [Chloroflexota bacterium]
MPNNNGSAGGVAVSGRSQGATATLDRPVKGEIDIRDLHVAYRDTKEGYEALKGISVVFPAHQITTIIGPSGCGKTTLLRSLNRLVDAAGDAELSGEIWVDGQNVLHPKTDVASLRKKIGLIAQRPTPLPMSIYDNVAYGPRLHGTRDKRKLDSIVQESLETVALWEEVKGRLKTPASKLSIGQQQRVCLARSLAVEPEILLADEPTSALDPVSSQTIEQELVELKSRYTIVMVTHNLRQARRLGDYVVFLYLGKLIEHGPSADVFQSPREQLTQAYIGGQIS